MPVSSTFSPARYHAELGDAFFDRVEPARFPGNILRHRNQDWAARVGLETLTDTEWIAHFARFEPLPGSLAQPLALRYHGHQFRSYNPDLGDGRGFLFAQLHDLKDGRLLDLGTKGSGTTPWSRAGDGRLTLKGGVREVLATEMLEALGVYTSKSFSLVETGEQLHRGDEPSPTRSAVLVRLNHSHVRIGSFQRFAYLEQPENISRLLDYTVSTYMPECQRKDEPARAAAFLAEVSRRVAHLGASWMAAGFVHGVLNTDNINVTGESFDYGPWRFLSTYDPAFTAAYFDHSGLYAYARQPDTLLWNLVRLAECLLPLGDKATLEQALHGFAPAFADAMTAAVIRRLGLRSQGMDRDAALSRTFWAFLQESQTSFEQAFFDLHGGLSRADGRVTAAHPIFATLRSALEGYDPACDARLSHSYFNRSTPRTMLIDDVEAIWAPITERDDWSALAQAIAEIHSMRDAYGHGP